MPTPIEKIEREFFNHLALQARFNPKEPIYGEENRRDIENLKSRFRSSLHSFALELASGIEGKAEAEEYTDIIHESSPEELKLARKFKDHRMLGRNQGFREAATFIREQVRK